MKEERFIYNDSVKEYYNSLINLKNSLTDNKILIENGLINNENNYDFITLMNRKVINKYDLIIDNINNILNWWKDYINDVDLLNNGFIKNNIDITEFENINYKEAKQLIDDNFIGD